MKRLRRSRTRRPARLLLAGLVSAALAGCGGDGGSDEDGGGVDPPGVGSGGPDSGGGPGGGVLANDVDGDGIVNSEDADFAGDVDGDGVPNAEDPDFDPNDRDGDGVPNAEDEDIDGDGILNAADPDPEGAIVADPLDVDGDGVVNSEDADFADDVDGDGVPNAEDPDFDPDDRDGDGVPNAEDEDIDGDGVLNAADPDDDGDGFDDPTAENPCGGIGGDDATSSNNTWIDNCVVSRENGFAESLYTLGIQRILYCTVEDVAAVDALEGFADGRFDAATEEALGAYQVLRELGGDGVVGPSTWDSLQAELELVEPTTFRGEGPHFDAYAVASARCGGRILFYNEVARSDDGLSIDRLGWRLAVGADPEPEGSVPFSIASPRGVVD